MSVKIVATGAGGFVEFDQATKRGHTRDRTRLYFGSESFEPFEADEIDPQTLPAGADGKPDTSGLCVSESGKVYRKVASATG